MPHQAKMLWVAGQEICEKEWELREPSESDKDALRDSEAEPLQHNISHSDRTSAVSSQPQTPQPLPSPQLPATSQPGLSPFGRLCHLLKALRSHPVTSPFPRLPRMPRLWEQGKLPGKPCLPLTPPPLGNPHQGIYTPSIPLPMLGILHTSLCKVPKMSAETIYFCPLYPGHIERVKGYCYSPKEATG